MKHLVNDKPTHSEIFMALLTQAVSLQVQRADSLQQLTSEIGMHIYRKIMRLETCQHPLNQLSQSHSFQIITSSFKTCITETLFRCNMNGRNASPFNGIDWLTTGIELKIWYLGISKDIAYARQTSRQGCWDWFGFVKDWSCFPVQTSHANFYGVNKIRQLQGFSISRVEMPFLGADQHCS